MIEYLIIVVLSLLWGYAVMRWAKAELDTDEWKMKWLNYNIRANLKRKYTPRKCGRKNSKAMYYKRSHPFS